MFKGLTLREFNDFFRREEDCRQYLYELKWKNGYRCKRCGHTKCWKGRTSFHARCSRCDYDESLSAHTIFHKIQIPLLKAFSMVFQISVLKKGISSMELSKLFEIDEKTALRFRGRVQDVMGAWISREGKKKKGKKITRLDSILLMNRGDKLNGLQRLNLTLEEYRTGTSDFRILKCTSAIPFATAIDPCHLLGGKYFGDVKDIRIWNFKCWLTGIHHHCSGKNIQKYMNEFLFRLNNRKRQNRIWHILIGEMMLSKPAYLHYEEV